MDYMESEEMIDLDLKVTQDPTIQPGNFTILQLMYESESIEIHREEEAYSF